MVLGWGGSWPTLDTHSLKEHSRKSCVNILFFFAFRIISAPQIFRIIQHFSGAFFQAGVAELTMACCCIGMALHGGVIPACGTFFVFSDYMKPAVRMAALMQLPVKFIWTHDAFRVGEDGPTHEPVEQEAQIRLMEKLKNHKGQNSMLVLRPADAQETTAAWKLAMENTATPTALILSRQNINNLPAGNDYSQAAKGAYIVAGSDNNVRKL